MRKRQHDFSVRDLRTDITKARLTTKRESFERQLLQHIEGFRSLRSLPDAIQLPPRLLAVQCCSFAFREVSELDACRDTLEFPANLTKSQRAHWHHLAEKHGLQSVSEV